MGSSDSESESECFESAEESLDENEEVKNEKIKLKKNIEKSENEDAKPVVSESNIENSTREVEQNVSNKSLSYRKRPERVKRQPSRTPIKPTTKSPTNDIIFKADKIVPDVFLQDITSNLSKNLNKSLSTLQQTSSNVKDLILNSLPVTSINEGGGFSYDDISFSYNDDNKESSTETNNQSDIPSKELHESKVEDSSYKNKEEISSPEKVLPVSDEISGNSDERKPEDINSNNIEKEKEFNLKDETTDDNLEKDIHDINKENLTEEESNIYLDSNTQNVQVENTSKDTSNSISEIAEDTQGLDSTNLNHEDSEVKDQKEANNEIDPVNFSEETDQEIEKLHPEPKISVEVKKDEETLKPEEIPSELVGNDNKINLAHLEKFDENNSKYLETEENNTNAECNLEELKTALKNIVSEENISAKENVDLEVKKEDNQSAGDGWDDFDFSDDEVENVNVNQSEGTKNVVNVKTNDGQLKSEPPVSSIKSVKEDPKVETKKSENSVPVKSPAKNSVQNKKSITTEKKDSKEKINEKVETNTEDNDSWDWDNWDETPENKEPEVQATKKSEIKEVKGNSFDVSNWSGWDTFAQKPQEKQDNWGLGSWGVDMLLNKATAVTQGISSVLEAGLGAPDPETLARMEKMQRENLKKTEKEVTDTENQHPVDIEKKNSLTNVNIFPVSGITSLVAGVTSKIVEHSKIQEIGTKVITGGLETLETFGKKTMEVLQEGDPGLKNKRALLLGNNKPVLSQVLKEAREKADRESKKAEEKELARKCHFETLFDDYQGMVHLEALEMLSRQCELKLEQIRSGMNPEEQEDLNGILEEVEQLCSLDEYDIEMKSSVLDFKNLLQMAVEPLKNEISIKSIIQIHEDVNKWLQMISETEPSFTLINQKFVSTLAQLTAATVHQFHKSGELLSVKECRKTVEEVDVLSRLTNALCTEINKMGEKFIKLSCSIKSADISGENVNAINEKVNIVTKNSIVYIRQAFDLLIPVIQLGAAV